MINIWRTNMEKHDIDKTASILKRSTYEEVDRALSKCSYHAGLDEMDTFMIRLEVMEEHGWTLADFADEYRERKIKKMVEQYNDRIEDPDYILNYALKHFPNARLIKAEIILE